MPRKGTDQLRPKSYSASCGKRGAGQAHAPDSAFVLAATFSAVTCLSSASAEDVQDQLKKLGTDRAAAAVKGDVEALENLRWERSDRSIRFTRIYMKKNGRWQSVAVQQTRVSNP